MILSIITIILLSISIVLILGIKNKVNTLQTSLELTLDKYMMIVRSLGIEEGNKQGKAQQVATQAKIDKGISDNPESQQIQGTVVGTIQQIKKTRVKKKV